MTSFPCITIRDRLGNELTVCTADDCGKYEDLGIVFERAVEKITPEFAMADDIDKIIKTVTDLEPMSPVEIAECYRKACEDVLAANPEVQIPVPRIARIGGSPTSSLR